MKVALVHDYIKEYGGAERVLEALHELYPDAPVFTSVYLPEFLGPHKKRFSGWDIRESWASRVPFKEKLISPLRLFSPFIFQSFDLSEFDVVIVSATGAYIPNSIQCHPERSEGSSKDSSQAQNDIRREPIHISYTHTPPRYLYGFATAREWKKNPIFRVIGEVGNFFLRKIDYRYAQNVDFFIANSINVKKRIEKFYRRDAVVIYPPVDTEISNIKYQISNKSQNTKYKIPNTKYYVAGGRLARPKHIDLIVKACRELDLPLKVFGRPFGGSEREILGYYDTKILGDGTKKSPSIPISQYPNIQFLGEVTDEEKLGLMRNAKAFLFAAEDEDFGITPVEAMSVGTPVIAYRSGGVVESVVESREGRTGIFFDELKVESLQKAIGSLDNLKISSDACIERAKEFSKERFKKEIRAFVDSVVNKRI